MAIQISDKGPDKVASDHVVAVVGGVPMTAIPDDLFIPPQALEVFLEAFEGPLDLLLYLIKRQNFDIAEIPLAKITDQYMRYIDLMEQLQLDLAGEYLLMAAILAEIKSKLLLPNPKGEDDDDTDPRAELLRRLEEYERYKQAADKLDSLPRLERDIWQAVATYPYQKAPRQHPEVSLDALLKAFSEVTARADLATLYRIKREPLSVRERMSVVLEGCGADDFIDFREFLVVQEGRGSVTVTLLAILELLKGALIEVVQNEFGGAIYIKAAG